MEHEWSWNDCTRQSAVFSTNLIAVVAADSKVQPLVRGRLYSSAGSERKLQDTWLSYLERKDYILELDMLS